MTDVYIESGDQPSSPSDAELILEVRGGDLDAYGALYARHAGAARRLAQSYVRNAADADDVVADAFARVLRVLQSGRGPDQMFRAYLFTVVKNVAIELAKGHRRMQPTDDEATFETALFSEVSSEDPALAGFEKTVVSRAYRNLPERWQAVLWYTEVEGYTPAQIAPVLGLTANGVSALAYRAREGLRVGYLQEHLSGFTADGCRTVNPLLGGYVRGSLASREIAKVDTHLKTCGDCRTLVLELSDVAHGMRGVIAPLVLGGLGLGLVSALPLGALVGAGVTSAAGAAGGAGVVGGAATGAAVTGSVGAAGSAGTAGAAAGTAGAAAGTAGAAAGAGAGAGAGAAGATGVGAGLAGATGTATGAVAGTAAGATTAGAAAATSGAGSIAAGLGAATASIATTAGPAAAATGASAATATASTAVASTLAASTAGAVAGTSSVAAAASAVAVAAVGVVTVLHALAPSSGDIPTPQPTSIVTTIPGLLTPSEIGPVESVPPQVSPSQLPVFAQAPVVALVDPAKLTVDPVSTGTLQPRVPQRVKLTVANSGEQTAVGTTVRFDLADGLTPVFASSTGAKGAPIAGLPLDAAALPCRPADDDAADVVCRVGDVPGGSTTTFAFDVVARSGGTYDINGQVWASGLKPAAIALPAIVDHYGAELTAGLGTLDGLANPGVGTLPISVVNSGDEPAAAGWSVDVTLPDGLALAGVEGGLDCTSDPQVPGHLTCVAANPATLGPGVGAFASLRVLAPATPTSGAVTASAVPVAADGGHVVAGTGAISVQAPWAGAAPVGVTTWCAATGNLATADVVVGGTFVNTTSQTVTARLEAAGSAAVGRALAPGESVKLALHDGARVPAGTATWILSTTVAGREYTTSVGGGDVAATDCYVPQWDVSTAVVPRNEGGQVRLTGTITNKTTEAMRVDLRAADRTSAPVTVAAGESATLVLDTQSRALPAGVATFGLSRWATDVDGDQPSAAFEPEKPATVRYAAAVLAPAIGGDGQATYVGACVYDPASETSSRTVAITLDNSGSTLPVAFTVGTAAVTVPAGETRTVEQRVVAGTTTLAVLADGRSLGTVPVQVASCASFAWPADVTASAQARCVPAGGPDSAPSVAVTVSDATGRSYEARTRLARGGWTGPVTVPGGGTAGLDVSPGSGLRARGGDVVVELARTIEGTRYTAEKTLGYDAVNCVVRKPGARLELGDIVVNQSAWWPTSSRTVGVVLDNTGSNVPVRFVVSGGPDGGSTSRTVRAGQTQTVGLGTVAGRKGTSISVRTDGWSTTLTVDPFTGTPGWCAPGWDGGTEARGGYAVGDVVSYGPTSYRYLGAAQPPVAAGPAGPGTPTGPGTATTPAAAASAAATPGTAAGSGQTPRGTIDGAARSDDRNAATTRDDERDTTKNRWGARWSGGGVSRSVGQTVPLFGSWVTPPPRSDVWQAAGSCEWRWPTGGQTTP